MGVNVYHLTVLCTCLAAVFADTRDDVCGSLNANLDAASDLNLNFATQFSANVEVVVTDELITNFDWRYSQSEGKILAERKFPAHDNLYMYDYNNTQTLTYDLTYYRGACSVTYSLEVTNDFWFLPNAPDTSGTVPTPLEALRLAGPSGFPGENIKLQDDGSTTVREVSVRQYTSCQMFNYLGVSYVAKVTHYLSEDSFIRLEKGVQPIQVVMEAKQDGSSDNTETRYFNFFHFASGDLANTNFDTATPLGVVCTGRLGGAGFPDSPKYISFIQEIHYPQSYNFKGYTMQTVYDQDNNYVYEETWNDAPGLSNTYRYDDFSTGLTYEVNPNFATCTIMNISSASSVNDYQYLDSNGDVRISTPQEFFGSSGVTYYYSGEYEFRGFKTDAWVGYESSTSKTVYEWYFYKDLDITVNLYVTTLNGDEPPIPYKRLLWTDDQTDDFYGVYIYGVDYTVPDFFVDLGLCYSGNSEYINLLIPGIIEDVALTDGTNIVRNAQQTIADALGISTIRVNNPKLYFQEGNGYLSFDLLGLPPYASDVASTNAEPNLSSCVDKLLSIVNDNSLILSVGSSTQEVLSEVQIVAPSTVGVKSSASYTSGDMGGLAFAMAVIGCGIGGVAGYWYFFKRV